MNNPEMCQFLRTDGICNKAPRPKFAIAVGNRVLLNLTPNVPSQAKLLVEAVDGNRFGCVGTQGLREQTRIERQQRCNNYQPKG